jgi:hypothetical protein
MIRRIKSILPRAWVLFWVIGLSYEAGMLTPYLLAKFAAPLVQAIAQKS